MSIKDLEKQHGLKYNAQGLLFNMPLRDVHHPIDHYIRDWMHTLVSGGVANVETGHLVNALKSIGIPATLLQEYSLEYVLSKKYGTVSASWLDPKRFGDDSLSSFASVMLTLVPIVSAFLIDFVAPENMIADHIECYRLLADILGLLSAGFEDVLPHLDTLQHLVELHHKLFVLIYPLSAVKPKWHHMLHLRDTYLRLRKIISCFVTARKHKVVKGASLFVFRNLEHTALCAVVHQQCEMVCEGHSLFQRRLLAHPSTIELMGERLHRSVDAVLDCGNIRVGDVVYSIGGIVSRILCFWQSNNQIVAQCHECVKVSEFIYRDDTRVAFIMAESIVDAMAYRPLGDGSIRVIMPYAARLG